MGKPTTTNNRRRRDGRDGRDEKKARVLRAVINAMCLLKGGAGFLLGGVAVGAQASNVLICLTAIFLGPAFVIELLV